MSGAWMQDWLVVGGLGGGMAIFWPIVSSTCTNCWTGSIALVDSCTEAGGDCCRVGGVHDVDGVGTLNHATNPNYPNTELRMSRIKTRTGSSVSGSTVAKARFSNQNKQVNPLFQKLNKTLTVLLEG